MSRPYERQPYDPADSGVPTGRKEEWRFTLRLLRGLHLDTALSKLLVLLDADNWMVRLLPYVIGGLL